jgi:uncharacterized damage-inducible protein DinB
MGEPRASSTLPAGVDHLRMIVGHHVWATLRLIDRCLELSQEDLALSTPGTYGSIHATLAHLVQGDAGFRRWIEDQEVVCAEQGPPPPVATLRADMERQGRRWRELLDSESALAATNAGLFLMQAVHHGAEHRTHVCSILGTHGLEVPDLSGWAYAGSGRTL